MKILIDIVLLIIIALCTWSGFKKGVVGGIAGIMAIVIALFGGSILSSAYSAEVIPALEPFVDGLMNSQDNRSAIVEKLGYGKSDLSLNDILTNDPSLRYDYAYECMLAIGFNSMRAEELAATTVELATRDDADITDAVVDVQCDTITYVAALTIAFLMIIILLVSAANILNISFRLPNMEALDEIGGAVLGFGKGFIYCVLISWLLSFLGLIIGKATMDQTTLANFFLAFDFITSGLM